MRKIIVGAQVSMDGVKQAPGGPTEDPTKGFKFGGGIAELFTEIKKYAVSRKKALCRRLDAARLQAETIARFERRRHDRTL
jgi:hypothetical protein